MPTYNSVATVDASAGDGNTTVTVAGDACLAQYYHYMGDIGATLDSLTINSVAMTSVLQLGDGANGSHAGTGAYFLDAPATGTQTVAWTWSNGDVARTNGGVIVLYFWDEDTGTISVLDSAAAGHASNSLVVTATSETTDVYATLHSAYDAGIASDIGTIRTADPIEINPSLFGVGYTGTGAATSTASTGTPSSYGSAIIVTLTELGGGSGPSTPSGLQGLGQGINVQRSTRLGGELEQ